MNAYKNELVYKTANVEQKNYFVNVRCESKFEEKAKM